MSEESQKYKFQAEIQKVLDILINRLYKNREIFLRELISNATDALHRVRIISLEKSEEILDADAELNIRVYFDEEENTITVSDNGIGMTYEEAVTNLGTIAQSGTLEFLQQMEKSSSDVANLIGQFGVGFYSSFIVSSEVVVQSRSYKSSSKGIEWRSKGSGEFEVAYADKPTRGTDVILHLKKDAKEFANKFKLESIIKKYSDFVTFPIRIGDEDAVINRQVPIWYQSTEDVEEKEYTEYYHQVSMDWTEPFHRIYLNVDAPIQFRALLFLPSQRSRLMMTSMYHDYGLRLYSKKILVQEKAKDILPEYFRFVIGVVDSEDLPLNVSREVVQVDLTLRRIKKVLTSKIIEELEKLSDEDEKKYLEWWDQFGIFLKEGITQDDKNRQKLLKLLRIKTSKSEDKLITLKEYIERMPEGQKEIFYLLGENEQTLRLSPHLEPFKKLEQEVILFYEPIDSFVMMHVTEFKDKSFKAIDQAEPEHPQEEDTEKETPEEKDEKQEFKKDEFLSKLLKILGDRVIDIKYTDLLTDSPCRLVNPSGTGAFTRVMKYMDEKYIPQKKIMEINKEHPLIVKMHSLFKENSDSSLLSMCTLQLLENQELVEGVLQDPTDMINRITQLMEKVLEK